MKSSGWYYGPIYSIVIIAMLITLMSDDVITVSNK